MSKLRSTYGGQLIYQTSYEERKAIHLQNWKVVGDNVCIIRLHCKWLS